MSWGPPARRVDDGASGEILIYSFPFYYNGVTTYNYRMFYADQDGKIYHWLMQSGTVPPQQMDVNLYVH